MATEKPMKSLVANDETTSFLVEATENLTKVDIFLLKVLSSLDSRTLDSRL